MKFGQIMLILGGILIIVFAITSTIITYQDSLKKAGEIVNCYDKHGNIIQGVECEYEPHEIFYYIPFMILMVMAGIGMIMFGWYGPI